MTSPGTSSPKSPGLRSISSIAIAVTTYRRNDLLPGLAERLVAQAASVGIPAEVLIVDNNPDGDAEPVVAGLQLPIRYAHEPHPGIAAGRNRAIAWAQEAGLDAVAFIDDDESPSAQWLASLLRTADALGCAAVTGPVVRDYPTQPSDFVVGMRRWDRERRPTGSDVPAASSANLLLRLDFLRAHGLRFDEAFGLSGGSDTLITRGIIASGGRVVWDDDAVVYDHVTAERLTPAWLRKRGRRVGNTHSRVSLVLAADPGARRRARAMLAAKGGALMVVGTAMQIGGAVAGNAERAGAGAWRRSRGWGILSGAFGAVAYDYRRDGHAPAQLPS